MIRKKIILHIGCGKTGSSALQNWLHRIATNLLESNILYPSALPISSNPYEITSGNGIPFFHAIKNGEAKKYLGGIISRPSQSILFSSEIFQEFSDKDLEEVNNVAATFGFDVKIVVYIRDVYDMVYSSYLQLIKRHSCSSTFSKWANSLKYEDIQQFNVLDKYERHFSEIEVINYDSHRVDGLDKPFCKAIGASLGDSLMMSKVKVNRSLTLLESSLIRICNEKYISIYKNDSDVFCRRISDALIANNPEIKTELYFDESVFKHLSQICASHLDRVNEKYLIGTPLSIFNPEGKEVTNILPVIHEIYETLIYLLIRNDVSCAANSVQEEKPASPQFQFKVQGRLDVFADKSVRGWARLLDSDQSAVVEVFVNDVKVGEAVADQYRADLSKIFNRSCAFEFYLSDEISIYEGDLIRARCTVDSNDLVGSPLKISKEEI